MEQLDSEDERKRELLRKSARHRDELEGEVKLITENTQRILTNALIIGGSLALTYVVVRQLTKAPKQKRKVKAAKIKLVKDDSSPQFEEVESSSSPGMFGAIGAAVASQASMFLLNLAKEKLSEFLESQSEKKSQG